MDIRETFVRKHITDAKERILELGPLNRPIIQKKDYPNSRYCDIRNTQEIKALYSGNAYLESTGIWVDTETIIDIDDVIQGTYSEFYANQEKFDVVIASHVLEHMDNLIFSLRDIAGILKPGGFFCIVYPDKRYCFDHFRQSATFREAYQVYCNGVSNNAPRVLDFFLSSVAENSPIRFWNEENILELLPNHEVSEAFRLYERARSGERMDDVHYWPFTDWDFLLFLRECTRMGLLPYRCTDFLSTQENDQQFFIALQMDPGVIETPAEALNDLKKALSRTLPHFYSSVELKMKEQLAEKNTQLSKALENVVERDNEIRLIQECVQKQQEQVAQLQRKNLLQNQELERSTENLKISLSRVSQLETIENSTIWKASAPIRRLLDLIKRATQRK